VYRTISEFQIYNENVVRQQVDEFNEVAKRKEDTLYQISSLTSYSKMDSFSAVVEEEVKQVKQNNNNDNYYNNPNNWH